MEAYSCWSKDTTTGKEKLSVNLRNMRAIKSKSCWSKDTTTGKEKLSVNLRNMWAIKK